MCVAQVIGKGGGNVPLDHVNVAGIRKPEGIFRYFDNGKSSFKSGYMCFVSMSQIKCIDA